MPVESWPLSVLVHPGQCMIPYDNTWYAIYLALMCTLGFTGYNRKTSHFLASPDTTEKPHISLESTHTLSTCQCSIFYCMIPTGFNHFRSGYIARACRYSLRLIYTRYSCMNECMNALMSWI